MFDELFQEAKERQMIQEAKKGKEYSEYIGNSAQKWSEIETGHHRDAKGRMIKAHVISERYAQNLKHWYLSKIDMTPYERRRLEDSKLFQILNDKLGIETTQKSNHEGEMIYMPNKEVLVTVRSIVTQTIKKATDVDKKAKVGDIVLIQAGSNRKFGSYDIGRVEAIEETHHIPMSVSQVADVITDASNEFKALSNELRKQTIKAEIEEKMKKVDERQKMRMYAEEDSGIKALLEELEQMDN